jgi:hypothetical protein
VTAPVTLLLGGPVRRPPQQNTPASRRRQRTETLVIETTFLDDRVSVEDARRMGHIHLDEVIARQDLLPSHDIVLHHFSARYAPDETARASASNACQGSSPLGCGSSAVEQAEADAEGEDGGAGGVRTSSRPCYARPRRALGYGNAVVAIALPLIGRSSS